MSGQWENYWTAGYTVTGSSDVEVERHCRSNSEAAGKATEAAEDALKCLRRLGLEGEVTIWTRHWRTRQVYEHDDKQTVLVKLTERRREIVELDR